MNREQRAKRLREKAYLEAKVRRSLAREELPEERFEDEMAELTRSLRASPGGQFHRFGCAS